MVKLNDINADKSLSQVLAKLANSIKVSMHCIKVGEIVSFDKTDQTATVRVLHVVDENYDTRLEETIEYPLIGKVPVVVMGGGGTYISHPIKAGDQCVLLFCDFMIDSWWISGTAQPSIVPRKHDISDAIAIVGLNASPNAIQAYSDYLDLHYNQNSSIVIGEQIDVNNATINLNGNTKVTGDETVTGTVTAPTLNATTAASGSFRSADNKTVTVVNGIVTSIA